MAAPASKYDIRKVFSNFAVHGDFVTGAPYGSGHINDTFCVQTDQGGTPVRYILQRINHNIFKNPTGVMQNILLVTEHLSRKIAENDKTRRALRVIPARDGKPFHQDAEGNTWRAYVFVEKGIGYDAVETTAQAYEAAKAFGEFQCLLADLPASKLIEAIPNFHNTPWRFGNLEKAIAKDALGRAKLCQKEIAFALARKDMCSKLLDLSAKGLVPQRITHQDTKLNNVLLDFGTNEGICVIDLDTVGPGLVHYDFGDQVRTTTCKTREDEEDLSKVVFIMEMYEALVKGYLETAKGFLTPTEIDNLYMAGRLMTFEVGIRFLTDFLEGDTYFKLAKENHNLIRCRTQFALVEQQEKLESEMKAIVAKFR